jgi:hypothetical protein
VSGDDGLVAVYAGNCPGCGRARRFEFALVGDLVASHQFGGAVASTLIDAGQYLAAADSAARTDHLQRAVAALDEVLKFVPAGADRVPESALFTDDGRATYRREPGRFGARRLEAVRGAYRERLAKQGGS